MALFPGQYNQAGGTWVDPSRLQTSQSGGAYIGGMAPPLPTMDMSFMWGGNGGASAAQPAATSGYGANPNLNPNYQTTGVNFFTDPGIVGGAGLSGNLGGNGAPTAGTLPFTPGSGQQTGGSLYGGAPAGVTGDWGNGQGMGAPMTEEQMRTMAYGAGGMPPGGGYAPVGGGGSTGGPSGTFGAFGVMGNGIAPQQTGGGMTQAGWDGGWGEGTGAPAGWSPSGPMTNEAPPGQMQGGMQPGGGYAEIPGMSTPSGAPATGTAGGWSQSMLGTQPPAAPPPGYMAAVANGSIAGPNKFAGNSLDLAYGDGTPGSYAAGGGAPAYGGDPYADPYLSGRADDITRRTTDMLGEAFAGIQGNAVGAGGLGGSRQAVAQGQAGAKAADFMAGQLANMYSGDWNQSQNRGLQKYGMDQSYGLGMGNLQLGNRNTDLNAITTGANLFNLGNQGWLGQGQGIYGVGNTVQQAPWQTINNATGNISPFTGYGASNTTSGNPGAGGVLGGALAGAQLGKLMFPNTVGGNWPTMGGSQYPGWGAPSGPTGGWT